MSRRELLLDILKCECYISVSREAKTMPAKIIKKYLRLDRSDIASLKFFFEGYDGVGTITTLDRYKAIVEVTIVPDFAADARRTLEALKNDIEFEEIESIQ